VHHQPRSAARARVDIAFESTPTPLPVLVVPFLFARLHGDFWRTARSRSHTKKQARHIVCDIKQEEVFVKTSRRWTKKSGRSHPHFDWVGIASRL